MPYLTSNINVSTIIMLAVAAAFAAYVFMRARKTGASLVAAALFGIWLIGLVYITLSPNPSRDGQTPPIAERFSTLALPQMFYAFRFGIPWQLPQMILNMVLFAPFGVLFPLVSSRKPGWIRTTLSACALSGLIELLQWLLPDSNRVFDTADILCNVFGAVVGFAVLELVRAAKSRSLRNWKTSLAPLLVCSAFALAAVRPVIHFPMDLPMPESALNLPKKVTARNTDTYDIGELPVLLGSEETLAQLQAGDGLYDAELARAAEQNGLTRGPMVSMCGLDEIVLRANAGAIVDSVSVFYGGGPASAEVTMGNPAYMMNTNGDALIPVWKLDARIDPATSAEGFWLDENGRSRMLREGEEDLVTDAMRELTIIVPAA